MLAYARLLVQRAQVLNWQIIVGDADGIDTAVMRECDRLGVVHTVWGAYGKFRNVSANGQRIAIDGDYAARDDMMVVECDFCVCVWNGTSSGTRRVYEQAIQSGKQAWLKEFKR